VKPRTDGTTILKGFQRQVHYKDDPLRETLLALIAGPTKSEAEDDYDSMIPANTRIRNLFVKDDVAYLDLNEEARFNPRGKDGQKAQVSQIVYTCTEFANVRSVAILIEGEKIDYLGPEGVFIGKPISREDCTGL
jgi:germination protein M